MIRSLVQKRAISDYIYLNLAESSYLPLKKQPKLRVSLNKSTQYYGHYSGRLNRYFNEDAYNAAVLKLPYNKGISADSVHRYLNVFDNIEHDENEDNFLQVFNFNIFDGHGGSYISKYLSNNMSNYVENFQQEDLNLEYLKNLITKYQKFFSNSDFYDDIRGNYFKKWLRTVDRQFEKIQNENTKELDDLYLRIFISYLSLDYKIMSNPTLLGNPRITSSNKEDIYFNGGSTSTSVYIYSLLSKSKNDSLYFNDDCVSKLIVSQVGDTKCILVDKFGVAHPLTSLHHPDNPVERLRLLNSTTNLIALDSFGEERFLNLANTRSFGDYNAKSQGVIAEPELKSLIIGNSNFISNHCPELAKNTIGQIGGDECFLVLLTDGVTDNCSSQEVADLIMSTYNLRGERLGTPQKCSEEVIHYIEAINGSDNATCLIIRLNGWGNWPIIDRTGKLREEKLNNSFGINRRSGTG